MIFNGEKKLLEWVETHILQFAFVLIFVIGLAVRYLFRNCQSSDAVIYLLPWYDEIKAGGGLKGLSQQVGDYNMLYQFVIALFTYLPIPAIYAYKIFSVVFDFALAWLVGRTLHTESGKETWGVFGFAVIWLSPLVFFNSAYWAQCDSIFTFFCILALVDLYREKYLPSFIFYGLAFAFKLQAVFLLPFFLFSYVYRKRYTILYYLLIPVMMIICSLPGLIAGRSFADVFGIYFNQTSTYPVMSMNAPGFWNLVDHLGTDGVYYELGRPAILLTVALLGCLMVAFFIKKPEWNFSNVLYMAFLLTYTTVFFLPSMHDRYGFLYEILGLMLVFVNRRTLFPYLGIFMISLAVYSNYLFGDLPISLYVLSLANLILYVVYLVLFFRKKEAGAQ